MALKAPTGSSCCDWPWGLFQIVEEQPEWRICSLQMPPQTDPAAELTKFGIKMMLKNSQWKQLMQK